MLAVNVRFLDHGAWGVGLNSARLFLWSVRELLGPGLPAWDPSYPHSNIS